MVRKVNSKRKNQEEANIKFRTSNAIQQGDGLDEMKARLQVMKFGGTSVGDAACIARTAQIIAKAAKESGCITVVSAMMQPLSFAAFAIICAVLAMQAAS